MTWYDMIWRDVTWRGLSCRDNMYACIHSYWMQCTMTPLLRDICRMLLEILDRHHALRYIDRKNEQLCTSANTLLSVTSQPYRIMDCNLEHCSAMHSTPLSVTSPHAWRFIDCRQGQSRRKEQRAKRKAGKIENRMELKRRFDSDKEKNGINIDRGWIGEIVVESTRSNLIPSNRMEYKTTHSTTSHTYNNIMEKLLTCSRVQVRTRTDIARSVTLQQLKST